MRSARVACSAAAALALLAGCTATAGPSTGGSPAPPEPVSVDSVAVEGTPPTAAVVLDPVPEGAVVRRVAPGPPQPLHPEIDPMQGAATLYADQAATDSTGRRLLLVGSSSGSAMIGGPRLDSPGAHPAGIIGEGNATIVPGEDRSWVVVSLGTDGVGYVVGLGLSEDELVAAAKAADYLGEPPSIDAAGLPAGLVPIVAGHPGDGPLTNRGAQIEVMVDGALVWVSWVQADPELATLWGFWAVSAAPLELPPDTVERRAGPMPGTIVGEGAYGLVYAEAGNVISVVGVRGIPPGDEPFDVAAAVEKVAAELRPGSAEELTALAARVLAVPTVADLQCPAGAPIITGRTGEVVWAYAAAPDPAWDGAFHQCAGVTNSVDGLRTQDEISHGDPSLPPVGQLIPGAHGGDETPDRPQHSGSLRTGVAPPGTVRVVVTAPDLSTWEASLTDSGPRPGEHLFAAYIPGYWSDLLADRAFTAAAFDAAGAMIDDAVLP